MPATYAARRKSLGAPDLLDGTSEVFCVFDEGNLTTAGTDEIPEIRATRRKTLGSTGIDGALENVCVVSGGDFITKSVTASERGSGMTCHGETAESDKGIASRVELLDTNKKYHERFNF